MECRSCGYKCCQYGCIDNELLMMLRTEKKTAKDVYLYDSIGADKEGNEISLMDVIEYTDEDVVEKLTVQERIRWLKGFVQKVLTRREQDIICMRYGIGGSEEKTQREIAQIYGISRSYVSRIEKKALEKLRRCYENME